MAMKLGAALQMILKIKTKLLSIINRILHHIGLILLSFILLLYK